MRAVKMLKRSIMTTNILQCPMLLHLFKHNRTRKVKARGYAKQQPRHEFIPKEEYSSLMVPIYILINHVSDMDEKGENYCYIIHSKHLTCVQKVISMDLMKKY